MLVLIRNDVALLRLVAISELLQICHVLLMLMLKILNILIQYDTKLEGL